MCDENNQLPGSAPTFTGNTAGGSWTLAGNNTLRHCVSCGFWYTGYHDCGAVTLAPNAGFAASPQPATVWAQSSFDKVAALAALRRLADELARLTKDVPGDEQAAVWAAYYELQAALTGGK